MIELGKESIIGQTDVLSALGRILDSKKLSHAYLFSGPEGCGKKAVALAFAEAVNGISNLTTLPKELQSSSKSSWRKHPDIHFFFPITTDLADDPQNVEFSGRLDLLAEDPYEIIDFEKRPSLKSDAEKTNKQSFYPIQYFRSTIRKSCLYKPNEGIRTVVIISRIELMRKESANAFLKLLEEPPEHILFILTTDKPEQLLPTITSRCQQLHFKNLSTSEVADALIKKDQISKQDAEVFARMTNGNYSLSRFYDLDALKSAQEEIMHFLRLSYSQKASELTQLIYDWQNRLNRENQLALLNMLESTLRDLLILQQTLDANLIHAISLKEAMMQFVKNLPKVRLDDMIAEIESAKAFIGQNGNFRLQMTVISMRYAKLMRGLKPVIAIEDSHLHQPAYVR